MRILLLALTVATAAHAQWDVQDSGTTADLRGIASVGKGIAWASGTNGTVLRTEDGGYLWQHCTTPPDAEKLDFRGIQAFDAKTAIVMSSGKGDLSRLYKTTDGCQSWKLVFTNPDKDGFWDAIRVTQPKTLYLLGDPTGGKFAMFFSEDSGDTWFTAGEPGLEAPPGLGVFAASNSAFFYADPSTLFGTSAGSTTSPQVYRTEILCGPRPDNPHASLASCSLGWARTDVQLGITGPSAGIFSLAARITHAKNGSVVTIALVVGGIYDKPNESKGTAASSADGGQHWQLAVTSPHGYRSAVAYDATTKTWITVGPNGTDISTDDGRNWRALHPSPGQQPDADQHWNALSLHFVVGPHGRIGIVNPAAFKTTNP